MQAESVIRFRRGLIEVLDRPGLEQRSCGCFHAVRHAERTIMGSSWENDGLAGQPRSAG